MGPGYVQGGTRSPPGCLEGPVRLVLNSGNLWSVGVLRHQAGPANFNQAQYFRRWTALRPSGAGANISAGFKSSSLAICRQ